MLRNRIVGLVVYAGLAAAVIASPASLGAVAAMDLATPDQTRLLRQVFFEADAFSAKEGDLPHHKAYKTDPKTGATTLVGVVFLTTDVEPDEWAYGGPIDILVGLTTEGVITAVRVLDHREPFGSFSIEPPEFADQFEGKSIFDPFEEGRDIDSVTRATITIEGAARVIRVSARKVARKYLLGKQSEQQ